MIAFPRVRSRAPLVALMLLLPALAAAQTVTYVSNGLISITGASSIYNGRYVLRQTDFGFLWLDTATLTPGHVQAESKCGGYAPPSDSGLYVIGDCNGITNISSSGNVVLVRQFNGQCGAATDGCNGRRDDGHSRFTFALGTWAYLGDQGEIPDSTQTTDPQGRTWDVQPTDFGGRNFLWTASGGMPGPPTAFATAVNLSAAGRSDKGNYYGDKWRLQDASTSGPTSVTWDFNYRGSFLADETGTEAAEGTVIGYFPCDPNGVVRGDIRSGANCIQSLGLTNPATLGNYQFAMQSANQYGSSNVFVSAPVQVVCPQASISGYTGFTGNCAKTGGTLNVLAGGNADASGSKGNLAEAQFSWVFTFSAGPPAGAQGLIVAVPNGAIGFTLTITFPAGYQATASGAVTVAQPIFVADFSTPSPVVKGSRFNLTNQMQKADSITLNSVDYLINPGACGTPPTIATNPLASSFLSVGGTAPVTAPNSIGGYCIYLRYNYTPQGSPQTSQIVSRPLTVIDWTASPAIGVYLDSGKTQPAPFIGGSFYLMTGTSYYLFDEEAPPPAGVTYPGAQWSLASSGSPDIVFGRTSTQTFLPVNFPTACSSGCSLKLAVGAVTQQIAVHISACLSNGTTLCLNGGRFKVQVIWTTADARTGAGQAVALTGDTGYFWFFGPDNVEMVVKVLDGRIVDSAFWVFAGGLTDVRVVMSVTDTQTGLVKTYLNPLGTAFQPIQDTTAFPAAMTPGPEEASSTGLFAATASAPAPSAEAAACAADAATLCLNKNRFRVQAQWTTGDGHTGAGQAVALTGDTGYFWFFGPDNVEVVVKVIDGCTFDSSFWVFAGGLTDVHVVMTVADTQTGLVKTYVNPLGTAFQPIQDTSAFPGCS